MSLFTSILKHLVTGNTPVTLGSSGDVFDSITFYGAKADGASNAGNVTVSPINPISGVSSVTITPGTTQTLLAPAGTTLTADQFQVNGANALDGVLASYFSAGSVTWNKIESKVEQAAELLMRTVPKLVAECAISRGVDTDTRTNPNAIICECSTATARPISQIPVGNYDCRLTVRVISQADAYTGDSSSFDPMAKHWERVAYVRDLLIDDLTPTLLSRFVADFFVLDAVRDADARTTVDDRSFVTELSVMLYAVGADLT